MKRLLSVLLAIVLSVGMLVGCQNNVSPDQTGTQNTEENLPPVEDDGVMKILLICHSLGVDSVFMFPDICKSEGVENLVVGFLYHSGCRVVQHLDYAKANAAQYAYYEYDISKDDVWQRADCNGHFENCLAGSANDKYIEDGSIAQTLEFGISRHDWDMVILQGGSTETADRKDSYYTSKGHELNLTGYIQELRDYVLSKDIEPRTVPEFSWNMVWSQPKDPSVRTERSNELLDREFGGSELKVYEEMARVCQEKIIPNFEWTYIFPNATTIQNLKSSTWENTKIYRDYAHVTDFGRWAAAYTWYCTMFDKDITECKLAPMNYKVVLDEVSRIRNMDLEWTQEQKDMLIEAVGNALKTPYAVTQSQY